MALKKNLALALAFGLVAGAVQAQDLRIGLQDDADVLDPDQARTFVGRIVFEDGPDGNGADDVRFTNWDER